MNLLFSSEAWEDYLYWQSNDRKTLKRVNALIEGAVRMPFEGIGKPEPLRYELAGWWSRRIDEEHRLIYRVEEETVFIAQCRYHY